VNQIDTTQATTVTQQYITTPMDSHAAAKTKRGKQNVSK